MPQARMPMLLRRHLGVTVFAFYEVEITLGPGCVVIVALRRLHNLRFSIGVMWTSARLFVNSKGFFSFACGQSLCRLFVQVLLLSVFCMRPCYFALVFFRLLQLRNRRLVGRKCSALLCPRDLGLYLFWTMVSALLVAMPLQLQAVSLNKLRSIVRLL